MAATTVARVNEAAGFTRRHRLQADDAYVIDGTAADAVAAAAAAESGRDLSEEADLDHDAIARAFAAFMRASAGDSAMESASASASASATESASAMGDEGLQCHHCGSSDIALMEGNYTCRECCTVAQRYLDHSAEWRYYGHDDARGADPARCGPPANELLPSIGSILSATGAMRGSIGSRMMRQYQMWNAMTYRERSLYSVCDFLSVSAARNGIPHAILEEAKNMYKKISELKISRGENRHAIIASCVYLSCKTNKVPRSISEVAEMFNLKDHCMTRACKTLQELLHVPVACSRPMDFVNRFCSKLDANADFTAACRRVVSRATALDVLSEYTPPSAVAGCILLVNDAHRAGISKKRIAEVCKISVVTISKCHKHLRPYAAELFA